MTMLISHEYLAELNQNAYRSDVSSVDILEEGFHTQHLGIPLPAYSPWIEEFNDKILKFQASGIFPYVHFRHFLINLSYHKKNGAIPPQVLTLDHLFVGFQICGIPMALSTFAFILEMEFWKTIPSMLGWFITRLISWYVVDVYFKNQRSI